MNGEEDRARRRAWLAGLAVGSTVVVEKAFPVSKADYYCAIRFVSKITPKNGTIVLDDGTRFNGQGLQLPYGERDQKIIREPSPARLKACERSRMVALIRGSDPWEWSDEILRVVADHIAILNLARDR